MKRRFSFIISVLLVLVLVTSAFSACAETVKLAYKGGSLRLRQGPGTEYSTVDFLSSGDYVSVLNKGEIWSRVVTWGGKVGYIKNLYIAGIGTDFADGTVYYGGSYKGVVTTKYWGSTVNLRSGASSSTASIEKLIGGTELKVLGENGNWYLVETQKGTQGFMSKDYVETKAAASKIYASVTGRSVNVRFGPGTEYFTIDTLAEGTVVQVLDRSNSDWWRISYDSTVGYMSANYLKLK